MRGRHILIRITRGDSGREPDLGLEGLRAAVGLVRSTEAHEVDLLLEGEGLRWLNGQTSAEAMAMLAQLRSADVRWYSTGGEAVEGVDLLDDSGVGKLVSEAEVVLRY